MRIAFCGASGTGKTTAAKALAETLKLPMNPVGSRSTAALLGFDDPYQVDKAAKAAYFARLGRTPVEEASPELLRQAAVDSLHASRDTESMRGVFQRRVQEGKIDWENAQEAFVTDRSTVDDFVYCAMHSCMAIDDDYLVRAKTHLQSYDLIFFTPLDVFFNTALDSSRQTSKAYHQVFETLADGTLVSWLESDWNHKVVVLHHSDLELRNKEILQAIKLEKLRRGDFI